MKKYCLSENELREKYISTFSNCDNILMQTEVPVFCRSVDLVVNDIREEILTAIEFKIHDWKKAIDQAQSIKLCFDFACICMPKPMTDPTLKQLTAECKKRSIGLILYDISEDTFETHYRSPSKQLVWSTQKIKIINYLGENNQWTNRGDC